ncbi:MAG: sugar phosphate isomerase/epimerase [Turicibacter sp.]|nr:sugar phosphate isomerase/epimerase [Turicibacter sp.]
MMRIGIRGHDLGKNTPEKFAQSVVDAKLESLQLVLPKAIEFSGEGPPILNDDLTREVKEQLDRHGVKVAMMGAYFNPIHSNKELALQTVENFKNHLKKAKFFGTELVGTETGSYNDDEWTWHEDNDSEEAFQEVLRVFKEILPVAEEAGVCLTIEPAYHHVISTPARLKRLVDELNSPHVRVIFDLFNLLHKGNTHEQHTLTDEMVALFSDQMMIVHAKDFVLEDGELVQVAPGRGDMDYPYLIEKLRTLNTTPDIILEGVVGEDIPFSRDFLAELLKK